jgi:hypothetical protein
MHIPVKVRRLDVAESVRLATAQQNHICRDKAICRQPNDIPNAYLAPRSFFKLLVHQDFSSVVIQGLVRGMSFLMLTFMYIDRRTMSSWISLNALATRTTASGTIVVYRPVGETFGTCCIQAEDLANNGRAD